MQAAPRYKIYNVLGTKMQGLCVSIGLGQTQLQGKGCKITFGLSTLAHTN